MVLVCLGVIFASWRVDTSEIWSHFAQTLLADLLLNSLKLTLGVLAGTLLLGVSLAWLVAACDFPGRRILSYALLLPMAMPAYVLAFVFLGLLDYAGPVQSAWRTILPSISFPNVQSTGGVVLVMSLVLYPYVYLLARNAFATQGVRMLEAARLMGYGPLGAFWRVVLPMARPWIVAGLMLVLMETLADFGAVSIFNYDTFTTAIYKAWFGFFSLHAAAQLASVLIVLVLGVVLVEQRMRSRMRFATTRIDRRHERIPLRGLPRVAATLYSWGIFGIAFLLPVGQLLLWSQEVLDAELNRRYVGYLIRSLSLGGMAALLVVAVALVLAYAARRHRDSLTRTLVRFSNLGYALPGTVLAVGIVIPVAAIDRGIVSLAGFTGFEVGQVLQGSVAIMLIAYLIRFMAAGQGTLESAMHRITPSVDEAARLMGTCGLGLLWRVHLPMLRGGLMTALTLVFVDVMKEMPITLMTRPFGWDTLAVKIFELTSEGEWERAALPALSLVVAGLLPILVMMRKGDA